MFSDDAKYQEQMKNIAVISSTKPSGEAIISCFVRKMICSDFTLIMPNKHHSFFSRKRTIMIIIINIKIPIEVLSKIR